MFDFGFTRFITNTWISIIWAINVVVACVVAVGGCVAGLAIGASGELAGFLLLTAPIVVVLWLLLSRMWLELTIVMFRIETHLRTIKDNSEKSQRL